MTLRERLGLSEARHRLVVRALQALLVGVIAFGVARASWGVVVNAVLALAVTFVPALLRREYNYSMDLGLVLWLTAAVVLHTLGTLGLYDWVWWFDHLAHTVSASVVAGMGYSLFRALNRRSLPAGNDRLGGREAGLRGTETDRSRAHCSLTTTNSARSRRQAMAWESAASAEASASRAASLSS